MSEKYIKNISEKGNAIIVGRGANSILKEYNPINIFVYANMESKINRCKQKADSEENLTDKEIGLEKKKVEINLSEHFTYKKLKGGFLCVLYKYLIQMTLGFIIYQVKILI